MKFRFELAVVALVACGGPTVHTAVIQPTAAPSPVDIAAATITSQDMRARIGFLASDALRGRDTPSPGLEVAAAYIASEFERFGLQPRGDNGSFLQRYDYTIRTLRAEATQLTLEFPNGKAAYLFARDFFAWPGSPASGEGTLVFAGTKLDDAAASSVRGKVAVVHVKGGLYRAWRAAVTSARTAAHAAGATGIMIVVDPSVTQENVKQAAASFSVSSSVAPTMTTIFLRYASAHDIFKAARQDLNGLVAKAGTSGFEPVTLTGVTARYSAPVNEVVHRPPNVVAVLPGSDPVLRDTYIVLSSHMDHVGVRAPDATGDSIYNGADDDASGTSAVLEIAEALASLKERPARSIVFLTVSGEEKGLLGSRYYSDHPTVPLSSIVANINIDMISRNAADTVVVIGQDYSSLGPLTADLVRAHPELNMTLTRDLWPQERFFFRSDHYNFAKKEIPAIFFFSGVHEDYHRPSDEVEKINADKAARIAKLAYYLAREIAIGREAPKWTEQGLKEVRAMTR